MLVGRDRELQDLLARVAARRAVVVTGPAGIGKTTLARAALARSGSWAAAGALATLAWTPLLVFRRLLGSDGGDDPRAVAAAVLRLGLDAVLLDDLQWADAASLDVIGHLVGQVAVVATLRSGEERSVPVTESLVGFGAEQVELSPLRVPAAQRLVGDLHPDLAPEEQASVVQRAGGNPLLLVELPDASNTSPSLVSALLSRLATLDPGARRAAERLAVLGRPAAEDLLGSGSPTLVDAGLAVETGGLLAVRHALLGEVIVELLGDDADWLRRRLAAEVPEAEAAHLLAAAGDRSAARLIARSAAEAAEEPADRAELLELVIRCAPEGELDGDLRLEVAHLYFDLSQPRRAAALCDRPELSGLDRIRRGALLGARAHAAWLMDQPQLGGELVERALGDLTGTRSPEEVRILAASTIFHTRLTLDGRPVLQRARDAVTLADEIGAHGDYARLRLASVLLTAGEPGWAALYAAVIVRARDTGDERARRSALTSLILAEWTEGDPQEAHRLAWEDVMAGPAHPHDASWLTHHAYAAVIGLLVGVDQQLLVERHEAVLDAEPLFHNRQFLEVAVGLALADMGRTTEAEWRSRGAPSRAGQHPEARAVAWWLMVETAWLAGRLDEAVRAATEVEALPVGEHPAVVQARLIGAHAQREAGAGALGGPEPASQMRAWRGAPLEWRALVASVEQRHGAASVCFDDAAEAWRGHDVRSEARCRWAAADEARLAADEDAVDRLRRAVEVAEIRRIEPLAARGRRSLRAIGVVSRAVSARGQRGLTSREEEVLRLVGAGRSSTGIAATLGVKSSTVESLVASATRKLGAPGRLAAAARLRDSDRPTS